MTLERFSSWVEQNYPPDRYDNVYDLINDVEQRVNADGNEMNEKIKQLLLDNFASYYDPRIRMAEQRLAEQQQVADMLGNGQIARGYSDDMVESFNSQRSEIMDIDFSEFSTTQEQVTPPEIRVFSNEPVLTRVKGFFASSFRRTTNFLRYGL